ncbi:hypothetical protein FUSNEC_GEN_295_03255 [Fusobacterium necrophorum subsp. funduliforme]|uniref:hypothetical protein n=1 Tax=Fusobacterium necrophorum TaxID=859 RepID=UPI00370F4EFE
MENNFNGNSRIESNKKEERRRGTKQMEGWIVHISFAEEGFCLENLVDAYIKERLLLT